MAFRNGSATALPLTQGDPAPPTPTLHDQTLTLSRTQKLQVFALLALNQMISFMDQNGTSVLLPHLAMTLHASNSISWAATSALVANAAFHLLSGRLSDLVGRKVVLITSLLVLSASCLVVGFSVTGPMLYVGRALAGMANGGVSAMTGNTVSDVCTLRERGRWQGILGTMVGVGTVLGPVVAGAFVMAGHWGGLFWVLSGMSAVAAGLSWRLLPQNMPKTGFWEKVKRIDFGGAGASAVAIVLILVPITQGGQEGTPWNSPLVVGALTAGLVALALFIWIEAKWARLPIVPLSMFRDRSIAAMMLQTFLFGTAFYSQIHQVPLYFQRVRGFTPLMATAHTLPFPIVQAVFSAASGQYITRVNRYWDVMIAGFCCWTLGQGILIAAGMETHIALVEVALAILGAGVGMTFNTNITAMQAHCAKSQRAVINSSRNFVRSAGGAVGMALTTAVLNASVKAMMPEGLAAAAGEAFAIPSVSTFADEERALVMDAYEAASRMGFVACVPLTGVCILLCFLVQNTDLKPTDERQRIVKDIESSPESSRAQSPVRVSRG